MELNAAIRLISTSNPSQSELADIYMTVPSLRDRVLSHPGTSQELRTWLIEQTRAGLIPPAPASGVPVPPQGGQSSAAQMASPVPPPPVAPAASPQAHIPTPSAPATGQQNFGATPSPGLAQQTSSIPTAGSHTGDVTGMVREIIKDDFSTPMTPRLVPIASRALWVFNAIITGAVFIVLVVLGVKMLDFNPLMGLLLVVIAVVSGPVEWVVYLVINRLAFELYVNAHLLAHRADRG